MIDQSELFELVTACLDGTASEAEQARLAELICHDPAAKRQYIQFMADTWILQGLARQPADSPLARSASEESTHHAPRDVCQAENQHTSSTPQLSRAPALQQSVAMDTHTHHAERDGYYDAPRDAQRPVRGSFVRTITHSVREVVWHPMAALLLVGLIATAVIIYQFSTAPTQQPVAVRPPITAPAEPAATLTGATDARWLGEFPTEGDAIAPGQRLVLERGSAMVTFNSQARVVFDAPVQFEIVDKGACRLVSGKLTAHVPDAAKGFQVQTPTGTITDLGTEFGVYVKTGMEEQPAAEEQEQSATSAPPPPPVTEVHVFRGQVELAQAPAPSQSQIPTPNSQKISAGQAVTISENKVEPLPAADPFKFALDKLQGKPRRVLLSDDFETYDLGNQVKAIGPWIVQSGTRKGQGVDVIDPVQKIAQSNAEGFTPLAPPPSLAGRRVAYVAAGAPNPPDTFPLLAREIDGRLLTQNCQVLLEFDVFLHGVGFQHSLALATEIGHTEGIELWRDANAAKKVDVAGMNWYRLRVLLDVVGGAPRDVHVDRSHWRGQDGWVRDLSFQPSLPKLDWSTPPRYVIFGYPVVTPSTPAGTVWIDNVRMEVISEK